MAYKLTETPLLRLAKMVAAGKWHSVMGIEVLLEQGCRQFELWMGRRCPRSVVSRTVFGGLPQVCVGRLVSSRDGKKRNHEKK
jgi:shikimate 5-dehydrogenase